MNNKTITLTGDYWKDKIPDGYTNQAECRTINACDYVVYIGAEPKIEQHNFDDHHCAFCLIPERKVIDWQKIISSGIPVEKYCSEGRWRITEIKSVEETENCRPAHNILFGHDGRDCPLPKGLKVMVTMRGFSGGNPDKRVGCPSDFTWSHNGSSFDIMIYKIIDLSPGYTYK